jgi:hypothetical protein
MFNTSPCWGSLAEEDRIYQLPLEKYFAFSKRAHRLFGNCMNRHACHANIAWLNSFRSRKLMPPIFFDSNNLYQAIQCTFLCSEFFPHQKYRVNCMSSSHSVAGSLKTLIVYVGIAWATALIITSLAIEDMFLSAQLLNLFTSFSLIL